MVRRLRDRMGAELVKFQMLDLSTAKVMAGTATAEETAAMEQATDEFVATAIQPPQAAGDDDEELPDFGDSS